MNKQIKYKKAQLTFFMILGFIILFLMAFVFYITKQTASYKIRTETLQSQETPLDIIGIKNYVTSCLQTTTDNGIRLLGEQGGVIYENQGGIIYEIKEPDIEYPLFSKHYLVLRQNNKENNVSYGLTNDTSCNGIDEIYCEKDPPEYPWSGFPEPDERRCNGKSGCFGLNFLPSLEGEDSMYLQLSTYVTNKIEECIDFSSFEKEGFDIIVDTTSILGKVHTKPGQLNINDETVVVLLKYPMTIITPTTQKLIEIEDFYYDTKVRLKTLHTIANELVKNDKNNEQFDINNPLDYSIITEIDEYLTIEVLKFDPVNIIIAPSKDNIVKITDTQNQDKPFIFQFARQNRPPALSYIYPQDVCSNDPVNQNSFIIKAYDPDEDEIIIYYNSSNLEIGTSDNPVSSFSPIPTINSKLTICVSDNEMKCKPDDESKDWQDVVC